MPNTSNLTLSSSCSVMSKTDVSSLSIGDCGDNRLFAKWIAPGSVTFGSMPITNILSRMRPSGPYVHFLIIEGGSILAIVGGLLSYFNGNSVVGNSGLLMGIAGIITALTPIIQGWLSGMREERKQKMERHAIANRVHGNQFTIELMKVELDDLRKSVTFKREIIERQQALIEALVRKVSTIETVSGVQADNAAATLIEQNRRLLELERSQNCKKVPLVGDPPA